LAYNVVYTKEAARQFSGLKDAGSKKAQYKAVVKGLRLLANDPRHPGLNTHEYISLKGPDGTKVWEAYAQNQTPGAFRIFFSYHPPKTNTITVLAITPHP
jgi:hypothetical protein